MQRSVSKCRVALDGGRIGGWRARWTSSAPPMRPGASRVHRSSSSTGSRHSSTRTASAPERCVRADRGRRRLELLVPRRARGRAVRAPPAAAAAAAALGARHGARGEAPARVGAPRDSPAADPRGLRGRRRAGRAVLRDALPRRARRRGELPSGLEEPAARRRLGEELVEALVEIHAADVDDPRARRVRPERS